MSFGLRAGSTELVGASIRTSKSGKRKKSLHGNLRLQSKKLKNQITAAECIKIIVRVRPITEKEFAIQDGNALEVCEGKSRVSALDKQYTFDQVLDQHSSQEQMFEAVGKPIVDGCLNGAHGSIFAYGQTGSGKTYTMLGDESFEGRGVIPRVLEYLFTQIVLKQESGEIASCSVACSFLEIYKEHVSDLLLEVPAILPVETASGKRSLQIRQDNAKRVYVENLTETSVSSVSQAQQLLHLGGKRKKVSKTNMNDSSSRSHTVFTLVVTCSLLVEGTLQKQTSRLNLVDLAGSESQRSAGTAGERLKEGSKINQSLSALGNVIMALTKMAPGGAKRKASEGTPKKGSKASHVPYRDSKLTWLLKDSLGGSAKTCLIANVSPSLSCVNETVSTLNFALRAKEVENKVVLNKGINEAELSVEVQNYIAEIHSKYQQEIADLQEQLAESRGKESDSNSSSSSSSSSSREGCRSLDCQCSYGADVVELAASVHQMQMRLFETRQELFHMQKKLPHELRPLPINSIASSFSFVGGGLPALSRSDTPVSSASFTFQTHAVTSPLLSSSASSSVSSSSLLCQSPCTPVVFLQPKLRPSAKVRSEPTAKNSTSHDRVPTPMVIRSNRGEAPPSSSSASHLAGFTELDEGEHKRNSNGEVGGNAAETAHQQLHQRLQYPSMTPVQHSEQAMHLNKSIHESERLAASPVLMHTSYELTSGGTPASLTHVSPRPITRGSLSPPTHFKFEPSSPSNSHFVSESSLITSSNDHSDNNSHLFTVHSEPFLEHVSPYRLRSADKQQQNTYAVANSSPPPHFKFHSTPSPNKYKTIVPTPPTKFSPANAIVFSSPISLSPSQEIKLTVTTASTPSRLPFSPLKSSELRVIPQRKLEDTIHLHPVNHLVDYFEEENSEPQKFVMEEPLKTAKKGQNKVEIQRKTKENSKPSQSLKNGKQFLRQAKLYTTALPR